MPRQANDSRHAGAGRNAAQGAAVLDYEENPQAGHWTGTETPEAMPPAMKRKPLGIR